MRDEIGPTPSPCRAARFNPRPHILRAVEIPGYLFKLFRLFFPFGSVFMLFIPLRTSLVDRAEGRRCRELVLQVARRRFIQHLGEPESIPFPLAVGIGGVGVCSRFCSHEGIPNVSGSFRHTSKCIIGPVPSRLCPGALGVPAKDLMSEPLVLAGSEQLRSETNPVYVPCALVNRVSALCAVPNTAAAMTTSGGVH